MNKTEIKMEIFEVASDFQERILEDVLLRHCSKYFILKCRTYIDVILKLLVYQSMEREEPQKQVCQVKGIRQRRMLIF